VAALSTDLDALLRLAVARGASDVHLKVPSAPLLRVDGRLERVNGFARLAPVDTEAALAHMLAAMPHSAKHQEFERRGEVDFAYAHPGLGRFRVNAFRQRGSVSVVLRLVRFGVPTIDDLGLPPELADLAAAEDGLVLVCGPAGAGVTSTLAALVDRINDGPPRSVITVEDPIEILHSDRECAINQREVGLDTGSFGEALARVLRHDPDVVMVGELPDAETVQVALNAADHGVLVLAAMPTGDPRETVDRLVSLFPVHRQGQARAVLGSCLRAIVCQRLVPREDGPGRRPVVEVLRGGPRARRAILNPEDAELLTELAAAAA
jgi:twitching motility protein PilT